MNREIKFRAKIIGTDSWIIGYPYSVYGNGVDSIQSIDNPKIIEYIDINTFGQFIEKTDKNGKEIYEGDIVKIPDDYDTYGFMAGEKREIYYKDGCFRFKPKENLNKQRGHTIEDDIDLCEVIGNIYENPELL